MKVPIRRRKLLGFICLGLAAFLIALGFLIYGAQDRPPLRILSGLKPVRNMVENPRSNAWYTTGRRSYYWLDRPYSDVIGEARNELKSAEGWRETEVASRTKITNFYLRKPQDEFIRMTIGVQEGWVEAMRGARVEAVKRGTWIEVAEASRRIGVVEKVVLKLKETFRGP